MHEKEQQDKPIKLGFMGDQQVLKALKDGSEPVDVVMTGGGRRVVIQAGILNALPMSHINSLYTGSMSAILGFYALQGKIGTAFDLLARQSVDTKFINPRRIWKPVDHSVFERAIRQNNPSAKEVIRSSQTSLYVSVTDSVTGVGKFVNLKAVRDPIAYIMASTRAPVVTGRITRSTKFVDGNVGQPIGGHAAVENGARNILLALNDTLDDTYTGYGKLVTKLRFGYLRKWGGMSSELLASMDSRHARAARELSDLLPEVIPADRDFHVGCIYPTETNIKRDTTDKRALVNGAQTAEKFTLDLLRTIT